MTGKKKNKRSKGFRLVIGLLVAAILIVMTLTVKQCVQEGEPGFVRYQEFGISIPSNYEIHGIDVSRYQQEIYWKRIKAMEVSGIKIGFAFIKATEGIGNVDKKFGQNWKNAKAAGVPVGAYHFFLATKSGRLQAENFIKRVKLESGDLPPVLDIEQLYGVSPEKMRAEIKIWLDIVEQHYGVKPILYTYVNFYDRYLGEDFDEYPLWVAHYLQQERPRIARNWQFWQYSESGRVDGIKPLVDFNVFRGDSSDFKKLLLP